MRDRGRYSRWALAGAALAALGAVDFVIVALAGFRGSSILSLIPALFAGASETLIGLGWLAGGPTCIVLGKLALRQIKRRPWLRGELLAQIVVMVGWMATLVVIFFVACATVVVWQFGAGP
jgi:hypothetical protein